MIEVTKMSSKGQITVPIELREALGLNEGAKVAFVSDESGRFYITNASTIALKNIQNEFEGEAAKAGFKNEDDVVSYIRELRKEKRAK